MFSSLGFQMLICRRILKETAAIQSEKQRRGQCFSLFRSSSSETREENREGFLFSWLQSRRIWWRELSDLEPDSSEDCFTVVVVDLITKNTKGGCVAEQIKGREDWAPDNRLLLDS